MLEEAAMKEFRTCNACLKGRCNASVAEAAEEHFGPLAGVGSFPCRTCRCESRCCWLLSPLRCQIASTQQLMHIQQVCAAELVGCKCLLSFRQTGFLLGSQSEGKQSE